MMSKCNNGNPLKRFSLRRSETACPYFSVNNEVTKRTQMSTVGMKSLIICNNADVQVSAKVLCICSRKKCYGCNRMVCVMSIFQKRSLLDTPQGAILTVPDFNTNKLLTGWPWLIIIIVITKGAALIESQWGKEKPYSLSWYIILSDTRFVFRVHFFVLI